MDYEAVKMAVFGERMREWLKTAFLAPGQFVTRKQMARAVPQKRLRNSDFDDEPMTGTAHRTARNPAFDG